MRFRIGPILVCVGFCVCLLAPLTVLSARAASPDSAPLVTNTAQPAGSAVTVPVTVTHNGTPVRGLTAADFVITEDGQPQTVTSFADANIPLSLAIIVDTSPQMRGPWMGDTFGAIRQLVSDALAPDDEVCMFVFARQPVLLQNWTNKGTMLTSQYRVPGDAAGAPLYDALTKASKQMDKATYKRRALVVVTGGSTSDGWHRTAGPAFRPPEGVATLPSPAAETSNPWTPSPAREQALKDLKSRALLFYAIGLDTPKSSDRKVEPMPPVNTDELRQASESTGGYTELVTSTDRLPTAIGRLKEELTSQYLLGFVPSRPSDGKFRALRVEVKNPDYKVRARAGYLAAKK